MNPIGSVLTGSLGKIVLLGSLYLLLAVVVWMEARELAHATSPRPTPVIHPRGSRSPRRLVLLEGVGPTQVELEGSEAVIGRDPGCDVMIPDSSVSHRHARVYQSDGQWLVEDLGSTNGTYFNDRPLTRPMLIRMGDKISVGRSVLEVRT